MTTLVGVVGAMESMVTLVVAVVVPFAFVAVRVYVVVLVGFTVVEAIRVLVEKLPGVMATEEAFEIFHKSVEEAPDRMKDGEAENDEMPGGAVADLNAAIIAESPAEADPHDHTGAIAEAFESRRSAA